jgi:hypothetical protein
MRKFADLNLFLIFGPSDNVAICEFAIGVSFLRFADPIIFVGLKTSAYLQIHNFYPYKYKLKMLSSILRTTFGLGDSFDLHGIS